jgi:2-polyprenyl-3-methyl-5-hydroxy-6-metoxy-1,4-benzoquinol methylase
MIVKTLAMHQITTSSIDFEGNSFAETLEENWAEQSEQLADVHLEAAIEAHLRDICIDDDNNADSTANHPPTDDSYTSSTITKSSQHPNFFSPYVPTCAQRIMAFINFVQLTNDDVLLDMGCGDGRVCLVATQAMLQQQQQQQASQNLDNASISRQGQFRAVGIDVSPDCIAMAQRIHAATTAKDTQQYSINDATVGTQSVSFYQADLTVDPNDLLCGTCTYFTLFPNNSHLEQIYIL